MCCACAARVSGERGRQDNRERRPNERPSRALRTSIRRPCPLHSQSCTCCVCIEQCNKRQKKSFCPSCSPHRPCCSPLLGGHLLMGIAHLSVALAATCVHEKKRKAEKEHAFRPGWSDSTSDRDPDWIAANPLDARRLAVLRSSTAVPLLQSKPVLDGGHLAPSLTKKAGSSSYARCCVSPVSHLLRNIVTKVTGLVGSRAARLPVFGPTENNDESGLVDPDWGTTEACLSSAKTPAHGGREPRQAERERQENQLPQMGG